MDRTSLDKSSNKHLSKYHTYSVQTILGCCTHACLLNKSSQLTATTQSSSNATSMNIDSKPIHPSAIEHTAPPLLPENIPENKQHLLSILRPGLEHMHTMRRARFSPYPSVCRTTAYSFGTQTWERAWRRWEERGAHGLWLVALKEEARWGCWWWSLRDWCWQRRVAGQYEYKCRDGKTEMKKRWSRLETWQSERIKKGICGVPDSSAPRQKKEMFGRTGGGRCCNWEPILSLWSDCLLDRKQQRQQQKSSEGCPAAATRRDLSSVSNSAVSPYYSQRLSCRDTPQQFSSSASQENQTGGKKKKKKKRALLASSALEISLYLAAAQIIHK